MTISDSFKYIEKEVSGYFSIVLTIYTMVKKIPSSFNILPQAIYIFAITILIVISGYFLFWLGKNASEVEDRVEMGVDTVYRNITRVGEDVVQYVEDDGSQYYRDIEDELDLESRKATLPTPTQPLPRNTTAPSTPSPTTPPEDCPNLLIKRGNQLVLYNKNKPEKEGENPIYFKNLDEYIYYMKVQRIQDNKHCPVLYLQEETTAQGEDVYRIRPGPFHTQGGAATGPSDASSIAQYFNGKPLGVPILGNQLMAQAPKPFNQLGLPNSVTLMKSGAPVTDPPSRYMPKHPPLDANRQLNPSGFYGFDPTSQSVGRYTVLDQIHDSTRTQNPNGLSDNPMDPNWGGAVFTNKQLISGKYASNSVEPPTAKDDLVRINNHTNTNMQSSPPLNSEPPRDATSDDPMDANWGGVNYTQSKIDSGKYAENNVEIVVNSQ
jgi:hypothetical protein